MRVILLIIVMFLAGCGVQKETIIPNKIIEDVVMSSSPHMETVIKSKTMLVERHDEMVSVPVPSPPPVVEVPQILEKVDIPKSIPYTNDVQTLPIIKVKLKPNILYNPPDIMTVGITERVEVRIGNDIVITGLRGKGLIHYDTILITPHMKVELRGEPEFKIIPLCNFQQLIPVSGFAQWIFEVTPLKSGEGELHLLISQRYPDGEFRDLDPIERTIVVKVNPKYSIIQWFKEYWNWLVGILISSGVLKLLYNRFTKKTE